MFLKKLAVASVSVKTEMKRNLNVKIRRKVASTVERTSSYDEPLGNAYLRRFPQSAPLDRF